MNQYFGEMETFLVQQRHVAAQDGTGLLGDEAVTTRVIRMYAAVVSQESDTSDPEQCVPVDVASLLKDPSYVNQDIQRLEVEAAYHNTCLQRGISMLVTSSELPVPRTVAKLLQRHCWRLVEIPYFVKILRSTPQYVSLHSIALTAPADWTVLHQPAVE